MRITKLTYFGKRQFNNAVHDGVMIILVHVLVQLVSRQQKALMASIEEDVHMASPEKSAKLDDQMDTDMDTGTDNGTAKRIPETSVYCWGNHCDGQLGIGGIEEEQAFSPVLLRALEGKGIVSIACGGDHTLFLTHDGQVYSCGNNDAGQLGREHSHKRPELVRGLADEKIVSIVCGRAHNAAITASGQLFTWGSNTHRQLAHRIDQALCMTPQLVRSPLSAKKIVQVACGSHHVISLTDTSEVYTWGCNAHGALGVGAGAGAMCGEPQYVASLRGVAGRQVAAGGAHCFLLTQPGALYGWGHNAHGQLGTGDNTDKFYPTQCKSLRSQRIRYVTCGEEHTAALTKDGGVFTFGAGMYGQLGHTSPAHELLPKKVFELMGSAVTAIGSGRAHTLAYVAASGRLYAFGLGANGQLGSGDAGKRVLPHPVPWPFAGKDGDGSGGNSGSGEKSGSGMKSGISGSKSGTNSGSGEKSGIKSGSGNSGSKSGSGEKSGSGANSGTESGSGTSGAKVNYDIRRTGTGSEKRNGSGAKVIAIKTGGDCCFLLLSHSQEPFVGSDYREVVPSTQILTLTPQLLESYKQLTADPPKHMLEETQKIFSSPGCVCASFTTEEDKHISRTFHGVDLDAAKAAFDTIHELKYQGLRHHIYRVLSKELVPFLPRPPDLEAMRLYLSLPLCGAFLDPIMAQDLICPFAAAVLRLEGAAATVMDDWWSRLRPSLFKRHVTIFKQVVLHILFQPKANSDFQVLIQQKNLRSCLDVLKRLNAVNERSGQIIRYDQFYIHDLSEKVSVREDFLNWVRQGQGHGSANASGRLSFCDFPFVFNAEAKTMLLQMDALVQMESAMDEVHRRNLTAMFVPMINPVNPCLVLYVHRNNLVQDTIAQLTKHGNYDFKKPLKVLFIGEEAQDAGGVRKEFFMLLLREILDPKYGMFIPREESHLLWFSDQTFEESQMFTLIGLLCGLAIYNATIINLNFPLALYKKLLKKPILLEDMEELDPVVGRSLTQLLEYSEGDEEDVFGLTFCLSRNMFDTTQEIDLMPNGCNIPVTKDNKEKYVEAYINYIFNESVEEQFKAFDEGFHRVCGGRVLHLFHPIELQSMVIGNEDYDWDEMKKNTVYKGEYYANHATILLFWEVFMDLPRQDKKKFLMFLTGSDRIPIHGMKAVQIKIQPTGGGENYLPVAHTCFNLLDLPKYTDKETLRSKLLLAIQHSEGFGIA